MNRYKNWYMKQKEEPSLDEYFKVQYIFGIIYPPVLYVFIQMLVTVVGSSYYSILYSKNINTVNATDTYAMVENVGAFIKAHSSVMTAWAAALGCIVFLGIFYKDCKSRQQGFLIAQLREVKLYQLGYPLLFAITANLGLSRLISLIPKGESMKQYEETSSFLMSGSLGIQLLTIAILVPVVEEVIYRGLVYGRVLRYLMPMHAMLFSAGVFAIFHFNLVQGIYAFILGVSLAYVYNKYQNLTYCILMHGVANGTAVLLNYFSISQFVTRHVLLYAFVMILELGVAGYCMYSLYSDKNECV